MLNLYVFFESNDWSISPSHNFKFINCLFGAVKLITNADKSKFIHNG